MKKYSIIFIILLTMLVMVACGSEEANNSNSNQGTSEGSDTNQETAEGVESGDTKEMKIGIGVAESHFVYDGLVEFKEYVEEETNGAISVDIYANNQLGNDREVLEAIDLGTAQMNLPSPAVLANFVPEYNLLTLPYVFPTKEKANEFADGPVGQEFLSRLESANYVGLGFGDFGFRNITNNERPIEGIEDFKDLKLRTMENPAHLDVFTELGANPTPMGWGEVFTALQQGVIDGQENPWQNAYSHKIHEVQQYGSATGHVFEFVVFVVGKDFYDSLSAEQQEIINEAANIAKEFMRVAEQEENQAAFEAMQAEGMEMNELSEEALEEIRNQVKSINEKYAEETDIDLYNQLIDEIEN